MNIKNRPLSLFESILYQFDRSSPFNILISVHCNGCIELNSIKEALTYVKKSHLYLNYHIEESTNPWFVFTKKLIRVMSYSDLSSFERKELLHREINTSSIQEDYPLAKAIVIQDDKNTEFILKISHIISDGISAYGLVKELFENMCILANSVQPVPYPMEHIQPKLSLFPEWKKQKVDNIEHHYPMQFSPAVPMDKRSTHIIEENINTVVSQKIFSFCQQNRFSVNSFLMSCLIKAMANKLQIGEEIHPITLKTSSGIDLRKYYDYHISTYNLGCWAGFGYLFYDLGTKIGYDISTKELAALYDAELKDSLLNNIPFFYLNALSELYRNKNAQELSSFTSSRLPYVLLTNIGKLDIPQTDALNVSIKRVGFITPMHRNWLNDLGFGLCASTTNGSLHLNFCYMSPAWQESDAQEFTKLILHFLQHIT
jgi:NRPS condensation-like uncharacterized protein